MDKMIQEKSTGFLIFRKNEQKEFLLLHYPAGHWDYPKGHVEKGETEIETALRELEEETGISEKDIEIIEGFRETIDYFYHKRYDMSHKQVVYFLGKSKTSDVQISREHQDYTWLEYENAMDRLTFKNAKNLLEKAKNFLDEKYIEQKS
ncbi:MAG: bis(5'-nucleosyl)-tetraphosphatase [Candidatus Saliniplasma sp.]